MIPPRGYVRALVRGYPQEVRRRCLLWMVSLYRAHVDDSGRGQQPVFVLAGFIGTVDHWCAFSDEWDTALKQAVRPLDYFKMGEAAGLRGQFEGWSEPDRDALLVDLIGIIERHAQVGVAAVVNHDDYKTVFAKNISKTMDDPYLFTFYGLMQVVHFYQYKRNDSNPVDFIFDEQGRLIGKALYAWKFWKHFSIPQVRPMLGDRPQSGDDRKLLPLQASDLLAWRTRALADKATDHDWVASMLPISMQLEVRTWNKPELESIMLKIREGQQRTGIQFPYQAPNRSERLKAEKLLAKLRAHSP